MSNDLETYRPIITLSRGCHLHPCGDPSYLSAVSQRFTFSSAGSSFNKKHPGLTKLLATISQSSIKERTVTSRLQLTSSSFSISPIFASASKTFSILLTWNRPHARKGKSLQQYSSTILITNSKYFFAILAKLKERSRRNPSLTLHFSSSLHLLDIVFQLVQKLPAHKDNAKHYSFNEAVASSSARYDMLKETTPKFLNKCHAYARC